MVAKKFCFPHCENSTTNALSRHDLHLFVIDEHYSECSTCAGGILHIGRKERLTLGMSPADP